MFFAAKMLIFQKKNVPLRTNKRMYYTAHGLVEEQLDYRAENEIRIKAIVIKGILNLQEYTLRDLLLANPFPLLTVESPDFCYVYSICYFSR